MFKSKAGKVLGALLLVGIAAVVGVIIQYAIRGPSPAVTFSPVALAPMPDSSWRDTGFYDGEYYLNWLGVLPNVVSCFDDIEPAGSITCFSKIDDFHIIADGWMETFPDKHFPIYLYSPRQVDGGYPDQTVCHPPNDLYPDGHCQFYLSNGLE